MNKVTCKACDEYTLQKVTPCIEEIINNYGGLDKLLENGRKVVIKPNLVMKKEPDGAATTHPVIIEALINILKKKTNDITIAECPGGPYTKERLTSIYKGTGIYDVAQKTGVKLNFDMDVAVLSCPEGRVTKNVTVLKVIDDADVFINVSKLKSHGYTVITGTAKNLYGLIPGLEKAQIHARFPDIEDFVSFICDINKVKKPTLSILDCIMCMEGNGPTAGMPRYVGMILGGKSTYAVDLVGAALINFNIKNIPLFTKAIEEGCCPENIDKIEILGDNYKNYIVKDFKMSDNHPPASMIGFITKVSNKFIRNILRPRPVINKNKCVGCGECRECCPQKAIDIKNRKAHINPENCILCYCCQELCPKKAVDIKRFFVFNFLK